MPSYRYECECGEVYDVQHSIHEDPGIDCENCGGEMSRIPQSPQVTFSGSGFYSTDNTPKRNT
jgi:putative FmdB family regulatory protein